MYRLEFTRLFSKNLGRYASLRKQIQHHVKDICNDPFQGSERLGITPGGSDLRGCRSVRVTHNFRLIFVVCQECRRVPECRFCFCNDLPDETVVFLTVGPHERAYSLQEVPAEYAVTQGV